MTEIKYEPSLSHLEASIASDDISPTLHSQSIIGRHGQNTVTIWDILDSSIIIPNKVAVARNNLCYERNYLSWLRLSLSLVAIGGSLITDINLEINSLAGTEKTIASKAFGIAFGIAGLLLLVLGTIEYFRELMQGIKGPRMRAQTWGTKVVIVLISIIGVGLVLFSLIGL